MVSAKEQGIKHYAAIILVTVGLFSWGFNVGSRMPSPPNPTLFIIDVEWVQTPINPGTWWLTYSLDGRIYAGHFRCEETLTDFITYLKSIANLWQSGCCHYE